MDSDTDIRLVLDDNTYTNKTWAEVSGISVSEIHIMEVEFLSNMRYTLYASEAEWKMWHIKLGRFWDYFNLASKAQLTSVKSTSHGQLVLTSRSERPSPQSTDSAVNSLANHQQKQASPPAHLPPFHPLASTQLPEFDFKGFGARKRNCEDNFPDRPPKRVSLTPSLAPNSALVPSASSTTTPTPSIDNPVTPSVPLLPMPNLSVAASSQYRNNHGSSLTHLPPPTGRAMSTVFQGSNRWPQNGPLPALQPTAHFNTAHITPPTGEWPSRRSPYPPGSATPSPTSFTFPPSQPQPPQTSQTPSHLSPSAFPISRDSPYKPVRSVHTLLVPPPSASMNDPPQNVADDRMHYQPLGKPLSERRAGVLPYMHHDNWLQPLHIPIQLSQSRF